MTDEELAEKVAIRMGVLPEDASQPLHRPWRIAEDCPSRQRGYTCDRRRGHKGLHIDLEYNYPISFHNNPPRINRYWTNDEADE